MSVLSVNFAESCGRIKPMHAVNNGPIKGVGFGGQDSGGYETWRAAGIPYARTHDSSFCAAYGGEHTVDIHAVFPCFDADETDPANYDFAITDHYLQQIQSCGTRVFYRLGSKIEHEVKKYNIHPPKDFYKWARICEHVIRHYTQGWANGFHYDITYWDIWNEPDLDDETSEIRRTWTGTAQQFYELFAITATHLKACFPQLKIGGPAVAYREAWMKGFFAYISMHHVPLDFFSWHCYGHRVEKMYERAAFVRSMLDQHGYTHAESILNEWNYIRSWNEFLYSMQHILSIKGAAFTAACMCGCQNDAPVDMLMYYDARPSRYNGLFDFYTNAPLKGYYPFKMFNALYSLQTACRCTTDEKHLYAAAAKDESSSAVMISYFADDDNCSEEKRLKLNLAAGAGEYDVFLLDASHDAALVGTVRASGEITLQPNTVCLLRSR